MSKFNQYVNADANYKSVNHYFNPNSKGVKLKCNYFVKRDSPNLFLSFWWDDSNMAKPYDDTREILSEYLAKATTRHLNDILCTAIQYAYNDKKQALSESKDEALEILKYIEEQEKEVYGK